MPASKELYEGIVDSHKYFDKKFCLEALEKYRDLCECRFDEKIREYIIASWFWMSKLN